MTWPNNDTGSWTYWCPEEAWFPLGTNTTFNQTEAILTHLGSIGVEPSGACKETLLKYVSVSRCDNPPVELQGLYVDSVDSGTELRRQCQAALCIQRCWRGRKSRRAWVNCPLDFPVDLSKVELCDPDVAASVNPSSPPLCDPGLYCKGGTKLHSRCEGCGEILPVIHASESLSFCKFCAERTCSDASNIGRCYENVEIESATNPRKPGAWISAEPKIPPGAYFLFAASMQNRQSQGSESEWHCKVQDEWTNLSASERSAWTMRVEEMQDQYREQKEQFKLYGRYQVPMESPVPSDPTNKSATASHQNSDESPEFSSEQIHVIIKETILSLIQQLSDSPRWQGASVDEIQRIVAEHQSAYTMGDGHMYSKVEVRQLSVEICRSCIDAFVAAEGDDPPDRD